MTGILNALIAGVSGAVKDAYFNLVSLLLPGNGTNGAQNNTFLDSSANTFTITRNGNTTQGTFSPFSQTGWSNYFAGGGNYLTVADSTAFDLPGDFTIEFEVYPLTRNNALFGLGDYRTANNGMSLYYDIGTGTLRLYSNGADVLIGASAVPLNQWSHIAIVRSGTSTNNLKLYINGVFDTQGTTNASFTGVAGNGVSINVDYGGSYQATGPTDYISNVRIVKGQALTSGNFTPPTAPLTTTSVGWTGANAASSLTGTISLLICQANRFRDASGNGFTVTPTGSPSVTPFSPFAPTAAYTTAAVGGSGYFDGTGDWLYTGTGLPSLGTSDFTIEMWIYPTTFASAIYPLYSTNNGAKADVMALEINTSGSLVWYVTGTTTWSITSASVGTLTLNQWSHIAFTRSGTSFKAYINGKYIQGAATSSQSVAAFNGFNIGQNGLPGGHFTGYMSSIRYVIGSAVYTGDFTPPTAPLTAVSGTSLLLNFTNAGVVDATAKNVLETVGNAQISTTQSKWGGGSIAFDGTGDAGVIQDSPVNRIGGGKYVIEFWYYAITLPTVTYILCKTGATGTTADWAFYTTSSTTLRFGDNTSSANTITGTIASGSWQHIAASWDGTTARLYVNGTLQSSSTNSLFNNFTSTQPIIVGASTNAGANGINGYLDDVRITRGSDRGYTGSTITVPTAPFPLQ